MDQDQRQLSEAGMHSHSPTASASAAVAPRTARPHFQLTTTESFDAAAIAPYRGDHTRVYQYIDTHLDEHLEHIRRWLRQPSVSAQNYGIEQMATLLRDDLRALGFREAELAPTAGHPGVWGYYDAGAPTTLLVYMMYDVQPVEPADWQAPPFEAQLVEHETGTVVMARGAMNQKGPERAFLNAVASILATAGRLPVNLMITAEGEEELSSLHYPEIVDRYEERLRAACGVLFPFLSQDLKGTAGLDLGVKGIVYFELEATGGGHGGPTKAEIHGSIKAAVDSPVWRLVQALASLTSPDGNTITIPGYYDAIRPLTAEEQRLINGVLRTWDDNVYKRLFAVECWIDGSDRKAALLRFLCDTTLNIDGIWSGYTGEGAKTILPHKATAKVDSRLVPNQRPDEALALIRRHLDAGGFRDVTIRKLGGYPPAQTSVESPLVQAVISVFNKYGHTPEVSPRMPGSAPYYQFTERLGLPIIAAGLGHGWNLHAPNEYMVIHPKPGSPIASLAEMEKAYVDLLYAVAL